MDTSNDLCLTFRRRANAAAVLTGSDKYPEIHGKVLFYQLNDGVLVRAEVSGLPKGNSPCESPVFAFHIHNGTACSGDLNDPFLNAGSHFNPDGCPHPYHAGDLPPLFGANGRAFSAFLTDRFEVSEVLGKPLIIHSHPDDFMTQPSGNAGEKIACGIITPTERSTLHFSTRQV